MTAFDKAVCVDAGGNIVLVRLVILGDRNKEYIFAECLGPLGFFIAQRPQTAGIEQQLALADVIVTGSPAIVAYAQSKSASTILKIQLTMPCFL